MLRLILTDILISIVTTTNTNDNTQTNINSRQILSLTLIQEFRLLKILQTIVNTKIEIASTK